MDEEKKEDAYKNKKKRCKGTKRWFGRRNSTRWKMDSKVSPLQRVQCMPLRFFRVIEQDRTCDKSLYLFLFGGRSGT